MMNKPTGPSRGRRMGSPDTRAAILEAARLLFMAQGYHAVTMRAIAADAGVDAALISYFFGSKKGLFGTVLALSANPPEVMLNAMPGDPATLPERVLRALIGAWDDPAHGEPLRALVHGAIADPEIARLLTEVLEEEMFAKIADHLSGSDARYRAAAFGTQLAGLVLTRYILRLNPVAEMSVDELIRYLAPGLHAALAGRAMPMHSRHLPPR